MASNVIGEPPDLVVGDYPSFVIRPQPPTWDPTAVATSVTVTTTSPTGATGTPANATPIGDNEWRYVAAEPVDTRGTWTWTVRVAGGINDTAVVRAVVH